jgi:hypothetical protein
VGVVGAVPISLFAAILLRQNTSLLTPQASSHMAVQKAPRLPATGAGLVVNSLDQVCHTLPFLLFPLAWIVALTCKEMLCCWLAKAERACGWKRIPAKDSTRSR